MIVAARFPFSRAHSLAGRADRVWAGGRSLVGPFLLLLGAALQAQSLPQVGYCLQIWYNQCLDPSLRNDSQLPAGFNDYNLQPGFTTNGLSFRRAQLEVEGQAVPSVDYRVMIDGAITTGPGNPNIFQDIFAVWRSPVPGLAVKAGQFKPLQTYEALLDPADILFAERSQLARVLGDPRDRGVVVRYGWGDQDGLHNRVHVGAFNGQGPGDPSGKSNDANDHKDLVARYEGAWGAAQEWGVYGLLGATDLADNPGAPLLARTFPGPGAPSPAQILADRDRTTNLGIFYVCRAGHLELSLDAATGRLGRRFPSLIQGTAPGPALRQALDQRYLAYAGTGSWTWGRQQVAFRYDLFDANWGNRSTTAFDPYTTVGTSPAPLRINGTPVDLTPRYRETTLGYAWALGSKGFRAANLKLNYIRRGRNFLQPMPGQTGAQGGDTLVAAFQVAR